jgi:uncharacterized protein
MIFHDRYSKVPADQVNHLVAQATMGRLITVSREGAPHLGLYPFARDGASIELHLARGDEQLDDLGARSTCLFEVDETLAFVPSHWEDSSNAALADVYYRVVLFEAEGSICQDEAQVARHLSDLLRRYQPEGGYAPLEETPEQYASYLERLALVRLRVTGMRVKFKLGQQLSDTARRGILDLLRERGGELDLRTARVVEGLL